MVWTVDLRRVIGARLTGAAAATLSLVALLAIGPRLLGPSSADIALACMVLAGGAAAVLALLQARKLRVEAEKVSNEIDTLSRHLLRIEARLADVDRQAGTGSRSAVAEVTGEIALLGGLVRDLAVTVAGHDRDIAAVKEALERVPARHRPSEGRPAPTVEADPGEARPAPARAASPQPTPPTAPDPAAPPSAHERPGADGKGRSVVVPLREAATAADGADARAGAAILAAFESDRLELHLQPIVALPQRKVRFYEALARLRLDDETLLVPAEFLSVLERAGHIPDLDRKVLARAAVVARHLATRGSEALVACNLSPVSLSEPGFLRAVNRLVELHPDIASRLILEIPQRSWRMLDAEQAGALAQLRGRGVALALDRAADLRVDPLALADRGVRYVKLPAAMLLGSEAARGLDIAVPDLAAVLARAGIRLVAERVEREEDVPNLIDLDVPLAQGFLFASPRAVRSDVLARRAPSTALPVAPAPPPVAPQASAPAPGEAERPPERLPLRAFLRRAG